MAETANIEVLNVPNYAKSKRYWIARIVDGYAWFYSAWSTDEDAFRAKTEDNDDRLIIVENTEAEA